MRFLGATLLVLLVVGGLIFQIAACSGAIDTNSTDYKQGYADGKQKGQIEGAETGRQLAQQDAFVKGRDVGYVDGVKKGYVVGFKAARPTETLGLTGVLQGTFKVVALLGALKLMIVLFGSAIALIAEGVGDVGRRTNTLVAVAAAGLTFTIMVTTRAEGALEDAAMTPLVGTTLPIWAIILIATVAGYLLVKLFEILGPRIEGPHWQALAIFLLVSLGTAIGQTIAVVAWKVPEPTDFVIAWVLVGLFGGGLLWVILEGLAQARVLWKAQQSNAALTQSSGSN